MAGDATLCEPSSSAKQSISPRTSEELKPAVAPDNADGANGDEILLGPVSLIFNSTFVPILLPLGVGAEDITVSAVENVNCLHIDVIWPVVLFSPSIILKHCIDDKSPPNYTTFHPEVVQMETTLKELRTSLLQKRSEKLI